MSDSSQQQEFKLPPEQQAIRDKCFHPSGTFVEFPFEDVETSIPARFERIVRMYPERVAIKTNDRTLTYNSLNVWANRIAHELLARSNDGIRPVAILLSKDVQQFASILGVLKSGKIYEVLEPSYPAARIRFILNNLQPALLITDSANFPLAQCLVEDDEILNVEGLDLQLSTNNLDLSIPANSIAWIHYTSASTGQPKGVMQTHRNVLNRVRRETNNHRICPDDRFIAPASRGGSLFLALLNGASVCPLDVRIEGLARLEQCINQDEVTIYDSVTSMFRYFVNQLNETIRFPTLRLIKLIGEPLYKRDVVLFRQHIHPFCVIVNRLGSNETGTFCEYNIFATTSLPEQVVPVGYPVQDVEVCLIENGKTSGVNDVGEFSVRSLYLSPGYWRNPALTEASFTPDSNGSGYVTYRTGDFGRILADGCFMHLGRKDLQVKILGNRVEIPEVEGALLSLGTIRETAVVAHDDKEGNKRLVAYFVPTAQHACRGHELQLALTGLLPSYMIPTMFIPMDKLPLTGTGKVDRRSLPIPDLERDIPPSPFVEPRTSGEELLAKLWAEVLAVDKIGVHDNFFDLGGHSLSATRIITRVIQTFQLELPMKALFDAPTVAEMTVIIEQHQQKQANDLELAQMLSEVEAMSDSEARQQLTPTDGE
jgi:amino acid adenylation domain-containing protein